MARQKGSAHKPKVASLVDVGVTLMLKVMGRVFTSKGKTFDEAIDKIKVSGGANAASVLEVEKEGIIRSKILNGKMAHALFGNGSPAFKQIHLQKVRALFDV